MPTSNVQPVVSKRTPESLSPCLSYRQVHDYVQVLKQEPQVRRVREQIPGPERSRQSPRSLRSPFPAPAQLAQVDEHSLELYVVTPDGIPVTHQVHAAVLICVKTAAIMSAVLTLGPSKRKTTCAWSKACWSPKIVSCSRLVVSTPGRVLANLPSFP